MPASRVSKERELQVVADPDGKAQVYKTPKGHAYKIVCTRPECVRNKAGMRWSTALDATGKKAEQSWTSCVTRWQEHVRAAHGRSGRRDIPYPNQYGSQDWLVIA